MNYLSIDIETGGLTPNYSLLEIGLVTDNLLAPDGGGTFPSARVVIIPDPVVIAPACLKMHQNLLAEIHVVSQADWWQELVADGYTYGTVDRDQPEALSDTLTCYTLHEGAPMALRHTLDCLNVHWTEEKLVAAGKNVAGFDLPFLAAHGLLEGSEDRLAAASADPGERAQRITEAAVDGYPPVLFLHRVLDPASLYVLPGDERPPDLATCLERAGLKPTHSHTAVGDALDVVRALRARLKS